MQWFQYDGDKIHNFTKKRQKCRFLSLAAVYYFCFNWI